jgi:dihydroorotase
VSAFLHPSITPFTVKAAKAAGITGVKSYPAGVTSFSASGVVDYQSFYPVFAAMEAEEMILNLHGESLP